MCSCCVVEFLKLMFKQVLTGFWYNSNKRGDAVKFFIKYGTYNKLMSFDFYLVTRVPNEYGNIYIYIFRKKSLNFLLT